MKAYTLCLLTDEAFRITAKNGKYVCRIFIGRKRYEVEPTVRLAAGCWKPDVSTGVPVFHKAETAEVSI